VVSIAAVDEIIEALRAQQRELDDLLSGLDDAQWGLESRCAGWSVADVVLHLAQTDEFALASAEGRLDELAPFVDTTAESDVDVAAAHAVEQQRGSDPAALHRRWRDSAEALSTRLAECEPGQRLPWLAGELSARTLATTRLSETWIHTGDIASALDVDLPDTDRLWHIARLAWRTIPYAFRRAGRPAPGPVALDLRAPDGSTWSFGDLSGEGEPTAIVRGPAVEFCLVAARRVDSARTSLSAEGADGAAVLELARTYA